MSDSIFPEMNVDLQQQIDNVETEVITLGKTFLFDFKKGDFVTQNGRLVIATEAEALKNWIEKVIRTEKFKFQIYKQYGITLEDLVLGNKINIYKESEIRREVTEALLIHPQILDIDMFSLNKNKNMLTISFTVILKDGTGVEQEVIINGR
ncbi:DUF2634 domain-containing protein [Clostridium sp. FP1]|uniref:DUF2634 domain-containing protein n=1 Tax=Clostridium sp. FP1 TaxID=2724076 RepID=UPI0013E96CFE|nr:DUF2634 domain-containing protein [Clostridium sp. FP1]MBZ9635492.1 DUF2634 domain-containing protein [Clostridium sp. FP1]